MLGMLGMLGFPLGHQAGSVGVLLVTLSPEEKHYVSLQKEQKHTQLIRERLDSNIITFTQICRNNQLCAAASWPQAVWLSDSYSEVSSWVRSGRRGLGCNLDIFLNICAWGHSNGSPLMDKHTHKHTHTHTHTHTQNKRRTASELAGGRITCFD